jgi:hypothetical protein
VQRRESGIALVVTLLAMAAAAAVAAGLALTASTEIRIAANFAAADAATYAAESAIERALVDLPPVQDWSGTIGGSSMSTFADGPSSGLRPLADGSQLDLAGTVNMANCQKRTPCSSAELSAITPQRPWGANNPTWRLFAYGPLASIQPGGVVESPYYVVAMTGDDPAENDGDPAHDGTTVANPGRGVIAIRGEAFGPRGVHAVVEVTAAAVFDTAGIPLPALRILSWRANP